MEYNIKALADLAGVSTRTLRYYDEIGLLKPLYVSESGYRYYGEKEVDLLQQILFYRVRGFDLKSIQSMLYESDFDVIKAMEDHLLELEEQQKQVEALILTVKQTILSMKGECKMSDKEKFQALKESIVKENEEKTGMEVRSKFGDEAMDSSNQKILNMTEEEWKRFKVLEEEIKEGLKKGVTMQIARDSEEAKQIVEKHKEWLCMTWKTYSKEAHRGVANMYVLDERFKSYYDAEVEGCAELLKSAIEYWMV